MKTKLPATTAMDDATAFGCVQNTIRLRSGLYFDLRDPKPEQFTFGDIAGALSKICRFGAQIDRFYSVAEHLIHCLDVARADGLPIEAQRAAFAHDFAEAFVGDVVKPLKIMLPEYAFVERRVELAIDEKFGIDSAKWRDVIREIDHAMLIAERRKLFSRDDVEWFGEKDVRKLEVCFECWQPSQAEAIFTAMASDIGLNP